jgi:diacylglycerol O-acyltransferase
MVTMPDRLTALDGTFLELEDADAAAHMHIGAILVFGPRPGGGSPDVDEVRSYLAPRLGALPRYTQRLAGPGAGGLTWQRWVPDELFDIDHHVTEATLPAPAEWEQLLTWAGDYFSMRLDRHRALWEVIVVGGLADDHWALVTKTHHCLVDGVGSVDAAHLLLDGVADAVVAPETRESSGFGPLRGWLSPSSLAHGVGARVHAAAHPRDLTRRAIALGELLVREELHGAPESSLNGPIGPRRTLRAVGIDLDEAQHVRSALGGTVNDVVLAGVCAGLRALLLARHEEPPAQGLRAMVPMNTRGADDGARALGNRISSLFVDLPVAEENAIVRYELVREAMAAVKDSSQPLGANSLLQLTGTAPPLVHHLIARTLFAKRLFNVTVTNVPGPQATLTALGAPLKTVWPLVPIAADHAVGIAIFSYDGRLTFGINADRTSVADVDVLADGIVDGLAELQKLAHAAAPA